MMNANDLNTALYEKMAAELQAQSVYPHSADYARAHNELDAYRASNRANYQCKLAIEAAVREHFDGLHLSNDAASGVIQAYGLERVLHVLANTVQLHDWDGRYSHRNKEWATSIPNHNSNTVRYGYALNSHPAVLDGLIDMVREEQQQERTPAGELSRPSVRDKLHNQPKETAPKRSAKRKEQTR